MTTFKYFSKTLLRYFLTLLFVFVVALALFIFGAFSMTKGTLFNETSPSDIANSLISNDQVLVSNENQELLEKEDVWFMVLEANGQISQSYQLPEDLDRDYSLVDVARASRWYLGDYPVFNFVVGEKLLILGYPKDTYAKMPGNYYRISDLYSFIKLSLMIGLVLLVLLFLIYYRSQMKLRKEFKPITQALADLSDNQPVALDEKGNLSEIKAALNQTSQLLIENKDLRSHWIRGVSHDLRNPLTLILGYINQLETSQGSNKQTQQIEANIHKMEGIISNLNMSYLLENHDIDQEMTEFDFNSLLRQIIADFYNNYEDLDLSFDLPHDATILSGNKTLLTRAINNLLLNSLTHNQDSKIQLSLVQEGEWAILKIADNGLISPNKILELNQKSRNYDTHGMGTIITKQIITLHKGTIQFEDNKPGLLVTIQLPLK